MENLKTEMQKNEVSVLSVSEVRWKGQGEIRSGDCTVYYILIYPTKMVGLPVKLVQINFVITR